MQFSSAIPRLSAGALLLLLGACAARAPLPENSAGYERHLAVLRELGSWRLHGRIAIQHQREGWSATLQWRQQGAEYVLRLSAPLGRGSVELSGSEAGVSMRTADNRLLHADDAEALMQDNLGWHVPLSGLSYWVRGMPEPGSRPERIALDEQGRLRDLAQDGWQVNYERYRSAGRYQLPGKLTLEHRQLRVRLVISDWIIPT